MLRYEKVWIRIKSQLLYQLSYAPEEVVIYASEACASRGMRDRSGHRAAEATARNRSTPPGDSGRDVYPRRNRRSAGSRSLPASTGSSPARAAGRPRCPFRSRPPRHQNEGLRKDGNDEAVGAFSPCVSYNLCLANKWQPISVK